MQALIIFDIDGTLFQTELVTVPAVQRTFAAYGLPEPAAATICSFFGRPNEEYLAWLAQLAGPDRAAEIVAATNRLELELVGQEGKLYSGARQTLDVLLAEGHVLAICSNGPEDYVGEFLDRHDIRRYIAMVRARGERHDGKEAMVREILESIPTRPAIIVGDRQDDIAAAHANGALAVATTYGFGAGHELHDADACANTAEEIVAAIHALLSKTRR
jgi:phosphoglycolate phosphatase-like HAD superfamily hydrolase